jgi:hypothetical protein
MFSCKKDASPAQIIVCLGSCMQWQVDSALSKPKGQLFYKIDAYEYNGAAVYLYHAGCCDRYNDLKDGNCNYLFSPSGGISGGGDGTHPIFFKEAKFIQTVWTDPRQ